MSRSLVVRTIPMPSRKDVLALYQQGLTTSEVSARLQISPAWARRVHQEFREQGKTRNATTRQRSKKWAAWAEQLREAVNQQPDITLEELEGKLQTGLHLSTLCRALKALKLTRKKRR